MNPRHRRAAARLDELIKEGEHVASLERQGTHGGAPYIQDYVALHAWAVKVENIVKNTFKTDSAHYVRLAEILGKSIEHEYHVRSIVGILNGALSDLEGGFLIGQEHLIAGEIFDDVLEEAKFLATNDFKDPAAVLVRVVVEQCLRRICRDEGLTDIAKAAILNDLLRDKGRYPKPQWRLVQSWLDIGNAAAHGDFDQYTATDVRNMIDDVERFIAQELRP